MSQPAIPKELPLEHTPYLQKKNYPRYNLGFTLTFEELRRKLPDLPPENHDAYRKVIDHYRPGYNGSEKLGKHQPLDFLPLSGNESSHEGVKFYVLNNKTQEALDVLSINPNFLVDVREFFELDDHIDFRWECWNWEKLGLYRHVFPNELPLQHTPELRSRNYPRYSLRFVFTLEELRKRFPNLPARDRDAYYKVIEHYLPAYNSSENLGGRHPLDYISLSNIEKAYVGIRFFILSNRSQKYLDLLEDPHFMNNVREYFGLDEDREFVWERWTD